MSQIVQLNSTQSEETQPRSQPTSSHPRAPFAKFDDRIKQISDRIIPKQPYLLTTPSDFPYRKHASDPNRWYANTPFHRREEQMQYMSLLLHQDDDESLLKVDGARIDEDGRLLARVPSPRSELPSRPETPIDTGSKKKISLKDYKTKDKSTVNTPERKPVDDIRRQAIKSHKEEVEVKKEAPVPVKTISEVKTEHQAEPVKPPTKPVKVEQKPSEVTSTKQDSESQRPVKKRRLSTEEEPKPRPHVNSAKFKDENFGKRELPGLLSPDMPASEKKQKQKPKDLPPLISPGLPAALEHASNTSHLSVIVRSDKVKAIPNTAIDFPTRSTGRKIVDSAAEDASNGRNRAESQLSAISLPVTKVSSPISRPASAGVHKGTAMPTVAQSVSPRPRQRHIVALRYGKKNRKRVEMLLKFAPRLKKTNEKEQPALFKPGIKTEAPKSDKKRPAESTIDAPLKKPKLAASALEPLTMQDRPSTPRPDTAGKSPALLAKPKSAFSTPKREPKSAAMQRVASTDTTEARTPSHDAARTSTPFTVGQFSQIKTSPAPTSTPARGEDHTFWADLQLKIYALGRTLKKEGTKLANEGKGKDKELGVILLIEALLCFMLNSAAMAQSRPHADSAWNTILPYLKMVMAYSRNHKHLHGLVTQLGAVCRQQLHQEHIRRFAKETLPDDHLTLAPTPGSDGVTKNADDNSRKQEAFLRLRDELVANVREMKTAWLEASKIFPLDVVEEQYPKTWRLRTKDTSKRNPEQPNPKELGKHFYLPIDVSVNTFEAANFALAFLYEWAMIEAVPWKAKIEL